MKPKKLVIKTVLNGWRVKVGCQEVVFTEKEKMLAEISAYLDDPAEAEKKYQEAVNYKHFEYAKQGVSLWKSSPISFAFESASGSPTQTVECNDDEPDAESEEVCPACKVTYAIKVDGAKVCGCPEKDE